VKSGGRFQPEVYRRVYRKVHRASLANGEALVHLSNSLEVPSVRPLTRTLSESLGGESNP
jgi:hypothetical protein